MLRKRHETARSFRGAWTSWHERRGGPRRPRHARSVVVPRRGPNQLKFEISTTHDLVCGASRVDGVKAGRSNAGLGRALMTLSTA